MLTASPHLLHVHSHLRPQPLTRRDAPLQLGNRGWRRQAAASYAQLAAVSTQVTTPQLWRCHRATSCVTSQQQQVPVLMTLHSCMLQRHCAAVLRIACCNTFVVLRMCQRPCAADCCSCDLALRPCAAVDCGATVLLAAATFLRCGLVLCSMRGIGARRARSTTIKLRTPVSSALSKGWLAGGGSPTTTGC